MVQIRTCTILLYPDLYLKIITFHIQLIQPVSYIINILKYSIAWYKKVRTLVDNHDIDSSRYTLYYL